MEPELRTDVADRRDIADVIRRAGISAWSLLGILLLLGALIWVLIRVEVLIAPVVLAVAIVYILNPFVRWCEHHHIPRMLGAFLGFLLLTAGLTVIGFLVVPSLVEQGSDFTERFPETYENARGEIDDLLDRLGVDYSLPDYDEFQRLLDDLQSREEIVSQALARLGDVTLGVLEAILVFFLAPVIAFYVLIDLPRVSRETVGLVPANLRDEAVHVGQQLSKAIGGFLRGQLLVALIVGVLMSIGFRIIGLPFWLIIGMLAGLLNIIPFVGPWVGGVLGVLVGLATVDLKTAFLAGIVALVVQQIDNNLISPTVLRATVHLHPAVIILVLLAGGAIGGLWGVILAVPVTAALKIVVGHLWRTRILGQSWEEASTAMIREADREPPLARVRSLADRDDDSAELPADPGDPESG